ncbi:hypothetical protein BGZ46_008986 [Entomortierella lignicola]|nr:hypothetical protein BGZ46_008986 [Entomortierella lignicola]
MLSQQASHPETTAASKSPSEFSIAPCTSEEAYELFYSWAKSEHWNPSTKGQDIQEIYHKADPEGFFIGKINENGKTVPVSIVSAVRYGQEQAWIGFYIVSPNYRGRDFGITTFRRALEHAGHGRPSVGLDAVMAQVENYKKSGFTEIGWQNERRHGSVKDLVENHERDLADKITRGEVPGLVHLTDDQVDLEQLSGIEERYAGLKRPEFVKDWALFHARHPEQHRFGAAVLSTDGTKDEKSGKPIILGYGCVRPAETSYRVGPIYASTPEVAKLLLVKLATEVVLAEKQTPYGVPLEFDVDIPNSNAEAVKIFDSIGWKDTFPSLRMWKGKVPEHDVNGVYSVSTLELA